MTKAQAIAEFRSIVGNAYRGDSIAKREAWLCWADSLCNEKRITQKQRDNWSNPF